MVSNVNEVRYQFTDRRNTGLSYAFTTDDLLETEGGEYDYFRLEQTKDGIFISVIEDDTFWVLDDVTDMFDVEAILEQCEEATGLDDLTQEFNDWLKETGQVEEEIYLVVNINL